jgi:hypothetical protein
VITVEVATVLYIYIDVLWLFGGTPLNLLCSLLQVLKERSFCSHPDY